MKMEFEEPERAPCEWDLLLGTFRQRVRRRKVKKFQIILWSTF